MEFERDERVVHEVFGLGIVVLDAGETAIVRFGDSIQECRKAEIRPHRDRLDQGRWDSAGHVTARALGLLISSVNDTWGVFSRSRIELLPHQLWVCHLVLRSWPTRWLVADDVGLGKTIEAGLILWPLLSKKRVRRLLVLTPASLAEQWQHRLRVMFDIRLTLYDAQLDTARSDYWNSEDMVVASIHTLRDDRNGRHERLLSSAPWDLVIVDEAHHLNYEQHKGPTLAFGLIEKLQRHEKVNSLLMFTGTPHKGKDFNFLALLGLLDKERIPDPRRAVRDYLEQFPGLIIRNNKYSVTDLNGEQLFEPPVVTNETYSYSAAEESFYNSMTEFILDGRAYSSSLTAHDRRTAQLVLIAFQKLASSSIAAVKRALRGRLTRIAKGQSELERGTRILQALREDLTATEDDVSALEAELVELSTWVHLVEDEPKWLRRLLEEAERVQDETKIEKILELVREGFAGRSVLFFTEYKATQSLLLSRLAEEYGPNSIGFINGDGRASDVLGRDLVQDRLEAAERFNAGMVRYLVSTEAAGEGVDLQRHCHTLIHVDLPWNPMRLHQRVGRLNRFGQNRRVEVVALRNPETVESRIWERLNEKIERVQLALDGAMEEKEDILQMVLGMTAPDTFERLFADAIDVPKESLRRWFDEATATFGGQDVIATVNTLVGNSARFDYRSAAPMIPKLDLPDIEPFFRLMLRLNQRRPSHGDEGLSFVTPDHWRDSIVVKRKYDAMLFKRGVPSEVSNDRLLGVGHPIIDRAVSQAEQLNARQAQVAGRELRYPLLLFRLQNRVTTAGSPISAVIRGVEILADDYQLVTEEDAFNIVNRIASSQVSFEASMSEPFTQETAIEHAHHWLEERTSRLNLPFELPHITFECGLWPCEP